MHKIVVTADSTCDLPKDLIDKYKIKTYPYTIILNEKAYKDNVDITPSVIFDTYYNDGILPKTSSINVGEYMEFFKPLVEDGHKIIHINLGSSLSSSHQNALIAATSFEDVYPIDSSNLSSGTGLLVLKAAELVTKGLDIVNIVDELNKYTKNIHSSFILDTLDFLFAGGRVSKLTSVGSNMLKIKPVIEVSNSQNGSMSSGMKYRGSIEKVIPKYIKDKLSQYDNINEDKIFIAQAGLDEECLNIATETIKSIYPSSTITYTTASCTISTHCGPKTLGLFFETLK